MSLEKQERLVAKAGGRGSLEIRQATHAYSGVTVLHDVDFELRHGEVHAMVGENGSGKSTMIRILTGAVQPVGGRMYLDGEELSFSSPVEAQERGIGVVHQEYQLFPDLTVAECVFGVGQKPPRRRWLRTIKRQEVRDHVAALFEELGIEIPPGVMSGSLDAAERKFVEIARAMAIRPRFLILDEVTASFEPTAATAVLDLVLRLAEVGVGICFVSHRLDEVQRIADRTTVLRDGHRVSTLTRDEASTERLIELIVGERRAPEAAEGPRAPAGGDADARASAGDADAHAPVGGVPAAAQGDGDPAAGPGSRDAAAARVARDGAEGPGKMMLRLPDLAPDGGGDPAELRAGEILGFTGLVGSGASALVRGIGGAEPLAQPIEVDGKRARIRTPRDAAALGIGFIPEDRKSDGVIPDQSVAINMALPALGQVSRFGFVSRRRLQALGDRYRETLDIRLPSIDAPLSTLSGGNQQKVILARWLSSGTGVIAVDEPTHGVDVGGRAHIHELLREFVAEGRAVVLASTDLDEILELCDRIGVFRHGRLSATVTPAELRDRGEPEQELLHLIGGTESAEAA